MAAPLEVYFLTFNCARTLIDPRLLGSHFFAAWPKHKADLPDIIAISLQEVAPIAYSFLGGSWVAPYLQRFEDAVDFAAKKRLEEQGRYGGEKTYDRLVARNLGMTALMVFVKSDLEEQVKWIRIAGTGVGVWEMGNKGAVGARLGFNNTEVTFVAMHLAPMEHAVMRRNLDWENIVKNLVFEDDIDIRFRKNKTSDDAEDEREPLLERASDKEVRELTGLYKPSSYVFVAGDLNYRTSLLPPTPHSHKTYPQPTTETKDSRNSPPRGLGSSESLRIPIEELLERDQLTQERLAGRTLHDFAEMPITFAPTYKYDNEDAIVPGPEVTSKDPDAITVLNEGMIREPEQWTWAKHRWPSWCDRILFLPSNNVKPGMYTSLPLLPTSDHRPVALSVTISSAPSDIAREDDPRLKSPFPPSIEWKTRRAAARRSEIIVGIACYLVLTIEGNAILVGLLGGGIAGYLLLRSLI